MKFEHIALKNIFLKDERFRISYDFSLESLALSLQRIGLISPPLVVSRGNHFILVSGWKRVLACCKLSLSPLPVFVVEEENDLKVFLLAFYENLATRELKLLEKAECLKKLKEFGEADKNIVRHYLPLLDIPTTLSHLDLFLSFSQFTPDVKRYIQGKNMPLASVKLLAEFLPEERSFLVPLISPLGQNKQKEILEYLQEISKKDDISVEKVFAFEGIRDVLSSDNFSPLQKADKIRLLLKKKRYPVLSSWEDSFDSLLKDLDWPEEIEVRPVPFFEEDKLSVSFAFRSKKQFREHLLKLQALSSKKEFYRMLPFK